MTYARWEPRPGGRSSARGTLDHGRLVEASLGVKYTCAAARAARREHCRAHRRRDVIWWRLSGAALGLAPMGILCQTRAEP